MVKGISRRVVVIDSPDQRYFEQAIFLVRNDAAGQGVTAQELVEEARRVARNYACGDHGRLTENKKRGGCLRQPPRLFVIPPRLRQGDPGSRHG